MTDKRVKQALEELGVQNTPTTICKLLMALAGSEEAIACRHDTILVGAAAMIAAFESITVTAADTLEMHKDHLR